jgi:hypothetical protein
MARTTNSKKTPNPAHPLSPTGRRARARAFATERREFLATLTVKERLALIAKRNAAPGLVAAARDRNALERRVKELEAREVTLLNERACALVDAEAARKAYGAEQAVHMSTSRELAELKVALDEERNLACETPPPGCDCPGCSYAREQSEGGLSDG